jgi:hypothetical protein
MSVEATSAEVSNGGYPLWNGEQPLDAAAPALDLIVAELKPLAVSLLIVGPDGSVRCRDARASRLAGDASSTTGTARSAVGHRSRRRRSPASIAASSASRTSPRRPASS